MKLKSNFPKPTGVAASRQSAAIFAALLCATLSASAREATPENLTPSRFSLGAAPLYFEPNHGQAGDGFQFIARGRDCGVLLAPTEAVLLLAGEPEGTVEGSPKVRAVDRAQPAETREVSFRLEGANSQARLSGLETLPGRANYLLGRDPAAWQTGVPLFARVRADEVYPGIALVYYCTQGQLEYDFLLAPRARPEQISFRITGADRLRVDAAGELVLAVGRHEVRQPKPVIFQTVAGVRKSIAGGYQLRGKDTVGFRLGDYDRNQPLVIDPTLEFSTYLGGKKLDYGWSIAADAAGNIFVAGETLSSGLSLTNLIAVGSGTYENKYRGGTRVFGDAFIAKYRNLGTNYQLDFFTYLGGKTDDGAMGLAVDAAGHAYVTGFTDSRNFPITPGAHHTNLLGTNLNALRVFPVDAFVAKLETNGSTLLYSTLLGGSRRDQGFAIAVDSAGCAYVTGYTESTNFPVVNALVEPTTNVTYHSFTNKHSSIATTNWFTNVIQSVAQITNRGRADAFVTKLNPNGTDLIYSSYLGGTNNDYGLGIAAGQIAVGTNFSAFVTGYTSSSNFPTPNALVITNAYNSNTFFGVNLNTQPNKSTATDAFISKFAADGSALSYSTYLGGSNNDAGLSIFVDAEDSAYVTGYTFSRNFPTNRIAQPRSSGTNSWTSHAFVTKIGTDANEVPYAAYSIEFGSSSTGEGTGIAVDTNFNAYVSGFCAWTNFFETNSTLVVTDLRSTNAIAGESKNANRGFVAVLDSTGENFRQGIYLGGKGNDQLHAIAIQPAGTNVNVFVVGQTDSKDLRTNNATQMYLGGVKKHSGTDAFVEWIQLP